MQRKATPDDSRIRQWANRNGHPIPDSQPIPETTRKRYREARAYMIRKSYARRGTGKTGKASRQGKAAFIIRNQDQSGT